jgi:hypothetical protein
VGPLTFRSLDYELGCGKPHLHIQVRPVANCVRCDRKLAAAFPALVVFSRFDFANVARTTCFASHTFEPSHCFESSHALRFSLEMIIDPAWWQGVQQLLPVTGISSGIVQL